MNSHVTLIACLALAVLLPEVRSQQTSGRPATRPQQELVVPATAGRTPGPESKGGAASRRAADYVPLATGGRWTYACASPGGEAVERTEEVTMTVPVGGPGLVYELRTRHGRDGYAYRGYRNDGVYDWRNALLGGLRGVSATAEPDPLLLDPIAAGRSWTRDGVLSVQTEGEVDPASLPDMKFKSTWTIEALDEQVVVPAGTFACVRVLRTDRGGHWSNETRSWFAAGVGLVQSTLTSQWNADRTTRTDRLTAFVPGTAERRRTADEVADTLALLPPFMNAGGRPKVESFRHADLDATFRAAFFVVTTADGRTRTVYYATPVQQNGSRLNSGTLAPLVPTEAGGFVALLKSEGLPLRTGFEGANDAGMLARTVATVLGASRGGTFAAAPLRDGVTARSEIAADGTITASAAVLGNHSDGSAFYVVVTVTTTSTEPPRIALTEAL